MTVVGTLTARDARALGDIAAEIADAYFDIDDVCFDEEAGVVTLSLEQESTGFSDERLDLPEPEVTRSTALFEDLKVPFVRCRLTIRRAEALQRGEGAGQMLFDLESESPWLRVAALDGDVRVRASALDVELEITDEVAYLMRRRVFRLLGIERDLKRI